MAEREKWIVTEGKEIVLYLAIGIFMVILLPIFGGFVARGFEESFQAGAFDISSYLGSFIIYFFLIIGSLSLIIYPIGRLIAVDRKDHPATQKNPSWFTIFTVSLIHSPEENGALYRLFHYLGLKKNPMRWSLSILRVTMISILFFGLLGIAQVIYPQLNIAGVPQTAQQLSTASDVIFGASVPAFSENGVLLFIFCFLAGINAYVCSKFRLGLGAFFAITIVIILPICALFWLGFHNIVYGSSDAKRFATFVFAFVGLFITILLASLIPFLVWHFMNNAFIKLAEVVAVKEDIIFIAFLIWGALLFSYIVAEIFIHRYKKKKKERIIVPE